MKKKLREPAKEDSFCAQFFLRLSYNGYYVTFPRLRRGFDSLQPHHFYETVAALPKSSHGDFLFCKTPTKRKRVKHEKRSADDIVCGNAAPTARVVAICGIITECKIKSFGNAKIR